MWIAALLLVACSIIATSARAADPTDSILAYGCDPPLPRSAANCATWHTSPVSLRWTLLDPNFTPVAGSSCDTTVVSVDTTGRDVTCAVENLANARVQKTVTLRVDQTAPTVSGATPDRPPDYDGWWTHPVVFSFAGTDATSGLAACDKINYSGPDGAAATVTGSCRDVAGNSSPTTTIPLKYDATPPTVSAAAAPGNASANVSWSPSADVVRSEVARTPGETAAPSTRVFDRATSSFMDVGLINGVTYSYKVTVFDQAGNPASAAVSAIPAAPAGLSSLTGTGRNARFSSPPLLRWKRARHASYYNVQLFRGRHKLLSAWPVKPHLQLRKTWRFRGHRYKLTRGGYRWYVWPGYGARAARRYGALVRSGTFLYRP